MRPDSAQDHTKVNKQKQICQRMQYKNISEIQDKIHKKLVIKLNKDKIPCQSVGIIENLKGKSFLEVIIDRQTRYSNPKIINKIPKIFHGFKIKVF